ncbi:MAG: hypothetical protein CMJ81_14555 [Planctomycetaceae bacterium]|nr:hypothetical protein [Planctomycetaceae bacterium]
MAVKVSVSPEFRLPLATIQRTQKPAPCAPPRGLAGAGSGKQKPVVITDLVHLFTKPHEGNGSY